MDLSHEELKVSLGEEGRRGRLDEMTGGVNRVRERQASVRWGLPTRLMEGHRVESDMVFMRTPCKRLGFRDAGDEELNIGTWEISEKALAAAWPGQTRTGRMRAGARAGEQRGRADRQGGGHLGRGKNREQNSPQLLFRIFCLEDACSPESAE